MTSIARRRSDRRVESSAHGIPSPLRLYIGLVVTLGVASLWLPGTWTVPVRDWLPPLLLLTGLSIALEFVMVPLPAGGRFSMATISHVATILLVPAPFAALSIGVSVLVEELIRRAAIHKTVFNVSGMLLTGSVASAAAGLFGSVWGASASPMTDYGLVVTFAAVAISYFGLNALLLSGVFALAEHRPMLSVLRASTGATLLGELATTAIGANIALIWVVEPVLVVLVAVPAAVIARSFEHIHRLRTETRSAVRNLAEIVDHRDPTTYHHSERVSVNAVRLAQALGLPAEQIELIEQAAAVHDLGKIGVPDRVLLKPGPLTAPEQETMREHTGLGSEILTRFELFRPGAEIVRHHHERWDGRGYPAGLAGEAIPLGARVVAVADAFDAMTSSRPYRGALSVKEALRRIAEGAGSQWDPRIARVFLDLMERTAERERSVVTNARRRRRLDDRTRGDHQPRRRPKQVDRSRPKAKSGRKSVQA